MIEINYFNDYSMNDSKDFNICFATIYIYTYINEVSLIVIYRIFQLNMIYLDIFKGTCLQVVPIILMTKLMLKQIC